MGKLIAGWLLEELVVRELVVGWLLEELVRCGGARRRLANGGAQCQNDGQNQSFVSDVAASHLIT